MKKTSLFLLLFVSVSSLRAMEPVDVADHLRRLNRVSDQAADLRRLLEEQSYELDREDRDRLHDPYGRSTDRSTITSSSGRPSDTGWGASGPQQTAPEFSGDQNAGDGSTFGAGADSPTEAQSEKSVQENLERGLRAEVGQDGSISFARRDGKKRGWNWFSSTTDYQEMNALDAKRKELKSSFENSNMHPDQKAAHLEDWQNVNRALTDRANRLKDNRSWFGLGGHTSKARDAQRLIHLSSFDDINFPKEAQGPQDAADQFTRRKGRSAADQRAVRGGFNDGVLSREAQGSQNASDRFNARKGRSAAGQRAVRGGFSGGDGPEQFTQPAPERASEQDYGVAGERSRSQMENKYLTLEARARLEAKRRNGKGGLLGRSSDWAAGNMGGDRDPNQFTTELNNDSQPQGLTSGGRDAQGRPDNTRSGMRSRADRLNRVELGASNMAENGGRFQQAADDLEKGMKNRKWWQF